MALTECGVQKICQKLALEAESFYFQVSTIVLQGMDTSYGKVAVHFDLSDGENKIPCFLL